MTVTQRLKSVGQKLFKKKNKPLKQWIKLEIANNKLCINAILSRPHYDIDRLCLFSRDQSEVLHVPSLKKNNGYTFEIDFEKVRKNISFEEGVLDLFFFIRVPEVFASEKQLAKLEDNAILVKDDKGISYIEYPIRVGRFQNTVINQWGKVDCEGSTFIPYVTSKGNISIAINNELNINAKTQINAIKIKDQKLTFSGKLFTNHSRIEEGNLVLLGRDTNATVKIPVSLEYLKEETEKKYGLARYRYNIPLNLTHVFQGDLSQEDVYDAYFELKLCDQEKPQLVRIGKPRFWARYLLRHGGHADLGDTMLVISPYFTFKGFNLSFQVDAFNKETFIYLKKMMRWARLLRPFYKKKDIWLVGERPYKAQDTGFHFFKYMREKHPKKNVYYVIEENSPELGNVKPYGNILYYKSKEHIWHCLMATKIIGSHHPDYLYPLRTQEFKKTVKALKVFLQHGVMGTKNMVANYGKNAPGFDTDLFIVSSDFEKNMIVQDFGYSPNEVVITGLSRFDSLLANDVPLKRQLLIIPTWRDWIVTYEAFLESEYLERWKNLVTDRRLHQLAETYDFEIVFCLHPNMQKFTPYFKDLPIRVISQGEVDVQRLIKESAMMITDYSSVAFDFSFLHKPVIYYQFDRSRFIGKRPSHFDMENDLPGEIFFEQDEIVDAVHEYASNGFQMKTEYQKRADRLLKYRDRGASERIYKAITSFKIKHKFIKRVMEDELSKALVRRFRRSSIYFPLMKLSYKIMKRILPVDKKLIVFESGLGKQVADSPRAIYDEIIRRGLDYKKIWIYNGNMRFNDIKTKRVKRFSPQYYYYLAKAGYWVNNQNFPTYIIKRPETVYLQTWHGTPLKKMQFDIESIKGRDDGYLERVYRATQTWDYLVSPSPYATKAFRSAFRYKGEILETGYPRNDIFYRPEKEQIARKVSNRLNLPKGKKVILYAPTFRDNQTIKNNKFVFNVNFDFEQMKEALGDEFILLLRMHVVVSNKITIPKEYEDFVLDVSKYPDIQELYLISDILITDYSSVMFDFANSRKPILFYTYDFETYRDELRGFYMDFEEEAPGPLLRTSEEIIHAILNIEEVKLKYAERYDAFYKKYCGLEDGKAAARVVDRVFQ
jgi:CDP-glycerol glycerophosphotransferase